MKLLKTLSFAFILAFLSVGVVGCGNLGVDVQIGKYQDQTFTGATSQTSYSLKQDGTTLTVNATIPYSASILGIPAGNIVAIKFTPNQTFTPDDQTSIKTTNAQAESGWNEYDKSALESDNSLIWVTSVAKDKSMQLKVKWNKDYPEVTYTLNVADDAVLATE